ncbi:MAG: hypothetical protein JWM35_587 [Verrucomicrobia bacterium]|nr:hypothetical protein [Verrucomicrobiota bacterium]
MNPPLFLARLVFTVSLLGCFAGSAGAAESAPATGKRVLFVYNQSDLEKAHAAVPAVPARIQAKESQRSNDHKLAAYFTGLGFTVTTTDEYSPATLAEGEDLIVISESVSAVEIGTKYRDTPVPLVTFENDLVGDLGMSDDKAGRDWDTEAGLRFVRIVNAPHPLAAGLAAGSQNVLSTDRFKMSWGRPALGSGATVIATLRGDPEKAAIFAFEKGASLTNDRVAPARRVMFFLDSDTFEQLRPEGLALLRATLLWAANVIPPQSQR